MMGIEIVFGFSSKASDVDNCCKVLIDSIATHYGFNDKLIYKMIVEKEIVKKGQEYIKFKLYNVEINKT